ncbi:hypothetical protein [Hyphomicrobium sp.]|jgi:hypothetical protein|uniref:hypothetical protein n=1 Tax=Hyphomicrobium sp. TaxID=82 RepID=UPI002CD8851A|nr:hypothetical protein [Hyphomicrobium sp.]HVZ03156.1 hypothetical protein [Hyphomicrobium sp.]
MEWLFKVAEQLSPIIAFWWDKLVSLLNSNFMAALAGAFAGAVVADRIATRKSKGAEISDALRNTNSAIALSGLISNQALVMKGQHVLDLHKDFALEEVRFEETMRRLQAGEALGPEERVIKTNLAELPELYVPIDELTALVFGKVKAGARAIGLLIAVQNALRDLNLSIQRRNQLCSKFRMTPPEDRVALYLGLPVEGGRDETYPQTISHIYQTTNDLAFFAMQLASELQEHGKKLAKRYAQTFHAQAPHVNEMKFDTPRARALMPPEAAYSDYLSMFHRVEAIQADRLFKRLHNRISALLG